MPPLSRAFFIAGKGDQAGRKFREFIPAEGALAFGRAEMTIGEETAEILVAGAGFDEDREDDAFVTRFNGTEFPLNLAQGEYASLSFDVDDTHVNDLLPVLATLGVENLTITPPSLEELFMRHYGDDLREEVPAS